MSKWYYSAFKFKADRGVTWLLLAFIIEQPEDEFSLDELRKSFRGVDELHLKYHKEKTLFRQLIQPPLNLIELRNARGEPVELTTRPAPRESGETEQTSTAKAALTARAVRGLRVLKTRLYDLPSTTKVIRTEELRKAMVQYLNVVFRKALGKEFSGQDPLSAFQALNWFMRWKIQVPIWNSLLAKLCSSCSTPADAGYLQKDARLSAVYWLVLHAACVFHENADHGGNRFHPVDDYLERIHKDGGTAGAQEVRDGLKSLVKYGLFEQQVRPDLCFCPNEKTLSILKSHEAELERLRETFLAFLHDLHDGKSSVELRKRYG